MNNRQNFSFVALYLLASLQNSQINSQTERACFRRGNEIPIIQILENVEPESDLFLDDRIVGETGNGENGTVKLSFIPEAANFLKFDGKQVKSVKSFFKEDLEELERLDFKNLVLCETLKPTRSTVYLNLELDILEIQFEKVGSIGNSTVSTDQTTFTLFVERNVLLGVLGQPLILINSQENLVVEQVDDENDENNGVRLIGQIKTIEV